jgi:Ca2+-binding EF-hand superfamily protein
VFEKIFKELDEDGNGKISREEFIQYFAHCYEKHAKEKVDLELKLREATEEIERMSRSKKVEVREVIKEVFVEKKGSHITHTQQSNHKCACDEEKVHDLVKELKHLSKINEE